MIYKVKVSYPKSSEHIVSIKENEYSELSVQRLDEHLAHMYPGNTHPIYTWSIYK